MESWAAEVDVHVLNVGFAWTCVRPQGSSIVDVSWASAATVPLVHKWEVWEEEEYLSDHKYVMLTIYSKRGVADLKVLRFPRWKLEKWNHDFFKAAVLGAAWSNRSK